MRADKLEREEMHRKATLALRLLDGAITDGAKGIIYKTAAGWLVDYGDGAEVDLPPLSAEDAFILVNDTLRMPFARINYRERSTMTIIHHAVWRKNREGEWMLFGPRRVFGDVRGVDVMKRDGTFERRRVHWKSKCFKVDGEDYCYARPQQARLCIECGGYHHMDEVRGLYAGGTMKTRAYWRSGEKLCSCGGLLAKEDT